MGMRAERREQQTALQDGGSGAYPATYELEGIYALLSEVLGHRSQTARVAG